MIHKRASTSDCISQFFAIAAKRDRILNIISRQDIISLMTLMGNLFTKPGFWFIYMMSLARCVTHTLCVCVPKVLQVFVVISFIRAESSFCFMTNKEHLEISKQ